MPPRTKAKVPTPASSKSNHLVCSTSASDILGSVCRDSHTSTRVKSLAAPAGEITTMRTARISGCDEDICHVCGSPWLHPRDMRVETDLPGITYPGDCYTAAQRSERYRRHQV
jgi:hypothetical protein